MFLCIFPLCIWTAILLWQPTKASYDASCGCLTWKCDTHEHNTPEYDSCVASNGCVYCSQCISSSSSCPTSCDTQSLCDSTTSSLKNRQISGTVWWIIAGSVAGILCCALLIIIIMFMYKIIKDDRELVLLKLQQLSQQESRRKTLVNNYTSESSKTSPNDHKDDAQKLGTISPSPESPTPNTQDNDDEHTPVGEMHADHVVPTTSPTETAPTDEYEHVNKYHANNTRNGNARNTGKLNIAMQHAPQQATMIIVTPPMATNISLISDEEVEDTAGSNKKPPVLSIVVDEQHVATDSMQVHVVHGNRTPSGSVTVSSRSSSSSASTPTAQDEDINDVVMDISGNSEALPSSANVYRKDTKTNWSNSQLLHLQKEMRQEMQRQMSLRNGGLNVSQHQHTGTRIVYEDEEVDQQIDHEAGYAAEVRL